MKKIFVFYIFIMLFYCTAAFWYSPPTDNIQKKINNNENIFIAIVNNINIINSYETDNYSSIDLEYELDIIENIKWNTKDGLFYDSIWKRKYSFEELNRNWATVQFNPEPLLKNKKYIIYNTGDLYLETYNFNVVPLDNNYSVEYNELLIFKKRQSYSYKLLSLVCWVLKKRNITRSTKCSNL